MSKPLGRFFMPVTSPIGSSSFAICVNPSAMASIRPASKYSRSSKPSGIPLARPLAISCALAAVSFFKFVGSFATTFFAWQALWPKASIVVVIVFVPL